MRRLSLSEETYSKLEEVQEMMAAEDESIESLEQTVRNLILIYEEFYVPLRKKSSSEG